MIKISFLVNTLDMKLTHYSGLLWFTEATVPKVTDVFHACCDWSLLLKHHTGSR